MVTKIKPVRIKQYNTPNPGNNLWYKDDTLFQWNTWWGGWGWDMYYANFNWVTKTWNSFDLDLSSKYVPTWNFTVNAPSDIKEWQTYLLRVDNWATAYTMSLWTWITNLQWTDITLTPNAIDMFVFLATKDWNDPVKLELQKEINTSSWWWIYYFFLNDETDQTELDNLWDWYNTLPDDEFDNSVIIIDYWNGSWQYPYDSPTWRYYYKNQDSADMYFFCENYTLKVQFTMQWWYTRIGVYSVTILPNYTAWTGINITGNEISSTVQWVPSGWTTGQVLTKTSGWIAWQNTADWNTKTFYLSSTSDTTNAQAAYDWYLAGKNPIVVYSGVTYTTYSQTSSSFVLMWWLDVWLSGSVTHIANKTLSFTISSDTVTAINTWYAPSSDYFLRTNYNYSTPYTPTYDWSPATKKYVDDKVISSATAPSSPTEWMLWYDTTNDVLKTYDGTNWNEVWGAWWDVVWPSSATDWHLALFDWATWKLIKDGGVVPTWFNPANAGSANQILVKTAAWYQWKTWNVNSFPIPDIWDNMWGIIASAWMWEENITQVYAGELSPDCYIVTSYVHQSNSTDWYWHIIGVGCANNSGWNYTIWDARVRRIDIAFNATTQLCISVTYTENIEPTVVSGDTWVTYTIKVSNSDPASWTASNIITLVP